MTPLSLIFNYWFIIEIKKLINEDFILIKRLQGLEFQQNKRRKEKENDGNEQIYGHEFNGVDIRS